MKTVLFLSANQPDKAWLRIDHEVRRVSRAIEEGPYGALRFCNRPAIRYIDLGPALLTDNPVVVHFSGHGHTGGRLVLFDQDDVPKDVDPQTISEVFAQGAVQLVVLNACFSEPLAKAMTDRGIDFVVGAVEKVPDEAALAFSEVLYRVLAHGGTLEEAFQQAVGASKLQVPGDHDYRLKVRPGAEPGRWTLVERPGPTEREPVQVVLRLDVYKGNAAPMPALSDRRRERMTLSLSDGGARVPQLEPGESIQLAEWRALGTAIDDLVARMRGKLAKHPGESVEYYIVGNAPLPVYAHLGFALSAWTDRVTVFNHDKRGGSCNELRLFAPPRAADLFLQKGLDHPSLATGRVAVYISVGREPDSDIGRKISAHLQERGEHLAGIVQLTTSESLEPRNIGSCARELVDILSRQLPSVYPSARGVDLYVAGPVTLAFCVGRAINPNQLDVVVAHYFGGEYTTAIRLPWMRGRGAPPSMAPHDLLERQKVLEDVRSVIGSFVTKLEIGHIRIPAGLLRGAEERDQISGSLKRRIERLRVDSTPADGSFHLDALEGKVRFGHAFLEALRWSSAEVRTRLTRLFLMHALYSYDQGVSASNYRGAGPAELILEEVDYWADAFALLTCAGWEIERGGAAAVERCGEILVENLDAYLDALALFDRMEHGDFLTDLPTRQIRRYLIWHLQRARAKTVTHPDHLARMLGFRLSAEVAPIDVKGAQPQLFVALDGRILRDFRSPGDFDPAALLRRIREGGEQNREEIERQMDVVVATNTRLLAPWAEPAPR
ncbi:MAG: CHAT domain-containing protein [Myxococcota bacterium]